MQALEEGAALQSRLPGAEQTVQKMQEWRVLFRLAWSLF
jgi:hypothetical protein